MSDADKPEQAAARPAVQPRSPALRKAMLGYDPIEDRLTLSGELDPAGDRVVFHLTRVLTLRLLSQLGDRVVALAGAAARAEGLDAKVLQARLEAQRRYAQSTLKFGSAAATLQTKASAIGSEASLDREGHSLPPAIVPCLIASVRLRTVGDAIALVFADMQGAGRARLVFSRAELQGFLAAVDVNVDRGGWRVTTAAQTVEAATSPSPGPVRILH